MGVAVRPSGVYFAFVLSVGNICVYHVFHGGGCSLTAPYTEVPFGVGLHTGRNVYYSVTYRERRIAAIEAVDAFVDNSGDTRRAGVEGQWMRRSTEAPRSGGFGSRPSSLPSLHFVMLQLVQYQEVW